MLVASPRRTAGTQAVDKPVLAELSTLDRFLPVWIIVAMAAGLLLGRLVPELSQGLDSLKIGSVSLPIAVGLLAMMYPVLAKVRYNETRRVTGDRKLLISSLMLNWIVGPALMFALAWLMLPDLPAHRTGWIIVGLARCIAMVMIWNELACGDRGAAAVLVAFNSVFQVVAFGALGWFYLQVLPGWLGLATTSADFSVWAITISVLVFLGIPLLTYFLITFTVAMVLGRYLKLGYAKSTTLAFTAAGNNFELAIAVAIGTFGVTSGQALTGVVGPLIEVPALVALVYVALWAGHRFFPGDPAVPARSDLSSSPAGP